VSRIDTERYADGEREEILLDDFDADEAACRVCGCTELEACDGGCIWVEADLCSRCVEGRP
jgi:hypothetical protein